MNWLDIVKKYGDQRKTELLQIEMPKEDKEIQEVIPEDCVVVMSKTGLIKRVPTKTFKPQKRGGKGNANISDAIMNIISTNTIDNLLLFTNKGKMYRLLVDMVPEGTNSSKGIGLTTPFLSQVLLNFKSGKLIPIRPITSLLTITFLFSILLLLLLLKK